MENSNAPFVRKTHPMILIAAASVTAVSLAGVVSLAGWMPARGEAPASVTAPLAAAPTTSAPAANTTTSAAPVIARNETPATLQIPAGSTITVEPKRSAAAGNSAPRPAARPAATPAVAEQETGYQRPPRATRVATQPVADNGIYAENARPAPVQAQNTSPAYNQQPAVCNDCGTVESVREVSNKGEGTGLGAVAGGVLGGLLGSQIGGGNGKKAMAVVGAAGGAFAGHEVEKRMRGETLYEVTVRYDDGRTRTFTETQTPRVQSGDRVRTTNGQLTMI